MARITRSSSLKVSNTCTYNPVTILSVSVSQYTQSHSAQANICYYRFIVFATSQNFIKRGRKNFYVRALKCRHLNVKVMTAKDRNSGEIMGTKSSFRDKNMQAYVVADTKSDSCNWKILGEKMDSKEKEIRNFKGMTIKKIDNCFICNAVYHKL